MFENIWYIYTWSFRPLGFACGYAVKLGCAVAFVCLLCSCPMYHKIILFIEVVQVLVIMYYFQPFG